MTNRRINKQMAADAAKRIVDKKYSQAINDIEEKIKDFSDTILKKYVPQPVLSVVDEHDQYFDWTQSFTIYCILSDDKGNKLMRSSYVSIKSNVKFPRKANYIVVTDKEFAEAKRLVETKNQICDAKRRTADEMSEIIRNCNTEKTLMKRYPDVHPYIEWPPVKALPANVTADWVNNLMNEIKKSSL